MDTSTLRLVPSRNVDVLLPLLRDAEEGDARIRQALDEPATTAYLAVSDELTVGAVVVRWGDESEIVYVATVPALRGQGCGKAILRAVIDAARARGVTSIIVGTANSSLSNIAFYQKCGFRIDSVRKDFFDYLSEPITEDGILMRDMLIFRFMLQPQP